MQRKNPIFVRNCPYIVLQRSTTVFADHYNHYIGRSSLLLMIATARGRLISKSIAANGTDYKRKLSHVTSSRNRPIECVLERETNVWAFYMRYAEKYNLSLPPPPTTTLCSSDA